MTTIITTRQLEDDFLIEAIEKKFGADHDKKLTVLFKEIREFIGDVLEHLEMNDIEVRRGHHRVVDCDVDMFCGSIEIHWMTSFASKVSHFDLSGKNNVRNFDSLIDNYLRSTQSRWNMAETRPSLHLSPADAERVRENIDAVRRRMEEDMYNSILYGSIPAVNTSSWGEPLRNVDIVSFEMPAVTVGA